jgi:transcriptional regulator with GAF, ATPase, and Fis domain
MAVADLTGSSMKSRALDANIDMVVPVDSAVLVQGETGTTREMIARAIHEASPRRQNRFAARERTLWERKGAFTGAGAQTVGRFQGGWSTSSYLRPNSA